MTIHNWIRGPAAVVGLAALLAMSAGQAEAAPSSCPGDFTENGTAKVHDDSGDKLTAASDCEWGGSGPASLSSVNAAGETGFFDGGWTDEVIKVEGSPDLGLSGTWEIPDPDFAALDYMIVFKDGEAFGLVAFLFNELYFEGGWDSPFTSDLSNDIGNTRDVSHYAIFSRDGNGNGGEILPPSVPEPGVLGLMGIGLLGLGLVAYNRRRRVA